MEFFFSLKGLYRHYNAISHYSMDTRRSLSGGKAVSASYWPPLCTQCTG